MKGSRPFLSLARFAAAVMATAAVHVSFADGIQDAVTNEPLPAKMQAFLAACRDKFRQADAAIEKAGGRLAAYQQVPGFPYFRSDRVLASFANQVDDPAVFNDWTLALRDNDSYSREIEMLNLAVPEQQRVEQLQGLRLCAVWLSNFELDDPATLRRAAAAAQIPEERKPAVLSPSAVAALDAETARRQSQIRAEYERQADAKSAATSLVLWQVNKTQPDDGAPSDFSKQPHDGMGRVGMTADMWRALAEKFAPSWLIETAGADDAIGAPAWQGNTVVIDPQRPYVYFTPTYARVEGRTLIQIDYFLWFNERRAFGSGDPDAGHLDGLIWRVTLDQDGKPLLYDSIRMSGFDQMWLVPSSFTLKKQAGSQDPLLIENIEPRQQPTVRLRSGTHMLGRAEAADGAAAAAKPYELHSYDELLTLPDGAGRTRSLFDAGGIVPGTDRPANAIYKLSRIPRAGALRQWGRHPTSLAARHYFDDPFLIDQLFLTGNVANVAALPPASRMASAP